VRIEGKTEFHSETGTEGGHWAVMANDGVHGRDELVDGKCPWGSMGRQGLCPVQEGSWHEHGRYEGLHVLANGDRLTIFEEDGETVKWRGEVELVRHPLFTEDAFGLWIHADQAGTNREEWASMFMKPHPCVLERG
jgi:hypothetical protein